MGMCEESSNDSHGVVHRRSQRNRPRVSYKEVDDDADVIRTEIDATKLAKLITTREYETFGPPTPARELTSEHLRQTGFRRPVLVEPEDGIGQTRETLGISLPDFELTAKKIVETVGRRTPVDIVDVATQMAGPSWRLDQWEEYFYKKENERGRLLNVVSLGLAKTPFAAMVTPPSAVEEIELVNRVWPKDDSNKPEVMLYALMSVANCVTDFHIDFGGSSVWYHVISGKKVFLLVPPTAENIDQFEQWSSCAEQFSTFYGDLADGILRAELKAGYTMLIPSGWPHAVLTPEDSIVVGGNFLHGLDMGRQLSVWKLEQRLGVKDQFRFPKYKQLMWHTAEHYLALLRSGQRDLDEGILAAELEGLQPLVDMLRLWCRRQQKGDIPMADNPNGLLEALEHEICRQEVKELHRKQCQGRTCNGKGTDGGCGVCCSVNALENHSRLPADQSQFTANGTFFAKGVINWPQGKVPRCQKFRKLSSILKVGGGEQAQQHSPVVATGHGSHVNPENEARNERMGLGKSLSKVKKVSRRTRVGAKRKLVRIHREDLARECENGEIMGKEVAKEFGGGLEFRGNTCLGKRKLGVEKRPAVRRDPREAFRNSGGKDEDGAKHKLLEIQQHINKEKSMLMRVMEIHANVEAGAMNVPDCGTRLELQIERQKMRILELGGSLDDIPDPPLPAPEPDPPQLILKPTSPTKRACADRCVRNSPELNTMDNGNDGVDYDHVHDSSHARKGDLHARKNDRTEGVRKSKERRRGVHKERGAKRKGPGVRAADGGIWGGKWSFRDTDGVLNGPFSFTEIKELKSKGKITNTTVLLHPMLGDVVSSKVFGSQTTEASSPCISLERGPRRPVRPNPMPNAPLSNERSPPNSALNQQFRRLVVQPAARPGTLSRPAGICGLESCEVGGPESAVRIPIKSGDHIPRAFVVENGGGSNSGRKPDCDDSKGSHGSDVMLPGGPMCGTEARRGGEHNTVLRMSGYTGDPLPTIPAVTGQRPGQTGDMDHENDSDDEWVKNRLEDEVIWKFKWVTGEWEGPVSLRELRKKVAKGVVSEEAVLKDEEMKVFVKLNRLLKGIPMNLLDSRVSKLRAQRAANAALPSTRADLPDTVMEIDDGDSSPHQMGLNAGSRSYYMKQNVAGVPMAHSAQPSVQVVMHSLPPPTPHQLQPPVPVQAPMPQHVPVPGRSPGCAPTTIVRGGLMIVPKTSQRAFQLPSPNPNGQQGGVPWQPSTTDQHRRSW